VFIPPFIGQESIQVKKADDDQSNPISSALTKATSSFLNSENTNSVFPSIEKIQKSDAGFKASNAFNDNQFECNKNFVLAPTASILNSNDSDLSIPLIIDLDSILVNNVNQLCPISSTLTKTTSSLNNNRSNDLIVNNNKKLVSQKKPFLKQDDTNILENKNQIATNDEKYVFF